MAGIFISYRREDSAGYTGRLYDLLSTHFEPKQLFVDLSSIAPGDAYPEVIDRHLATCRVLLAVLGTRWLTAVDAQGQSRLQNPKDYVRREVATALERGITVVPLLVGGAKMPHAPDLPEDLAKLAHCQALQISDVDFHHDVSRLVEALDKIVKPAAVRTHKAKTIQLRAEAQSLSTDEVKAMLVVQGFYCAGWNATGAGIAHEYKVTVAAGAIVVIDSAVNLMWQKSGSSECFSFADTHLYIENLNSRKFGGFTDWRMPTLEEAMSVMSPAKQGTTHLPPELDGGPILWTADRFSGQAEDRGWIVWFGDGNCGPENTAFNGWARAVRSV